MQGFIKPLTGIFALLYIIPVIGSIQTILMLGLWVFEGVFDVKIYDTVIGMGMPTLPAMLITGGFAVSVIWAGYQAILYCASFKLGEDFWTAIIMVVGGWSFWLLTLLRGGVNIPHRPVPNMLDSIEAVTGVSSGFTITAVIGLYITTSWVWSFYTGKSKLYK